MASTDGSFLASAEGYSDHYEEKGVFDRLMDRLRKIVPRAQGYAPVMLPALR